MADRHSGTIIAAGGVLIAAGGIFMTVTGFEPAAKPTTVWANSWFDLGLAFVILGLAIATVGVVAHFRREVEGASAPAVVDAPPTAGLPAAAQQSALSPVNRAEWEATCEESGEFPDTKALVFGLKHLPDNPNAMQNLATLRCTVTDPDGRRTEAENIGFHCRYTPDNFPGAPPVRPGLYRSKWQAKVRGGDWENIADGEHMVNAPDLIVTIMKSQFENWKHIALIAALRVKITNTTGDMIRLSTIGFTYDPEGKPGSGTNLSADERLEIDRELRARRERQHYGIPIHNYATIPARESISGWVVEAVTRDPAGGTPRCTVVIKDELGNEYRATLPKREPQTAD
jgi:hypothetical protein